MSNTEIKTCYNLLVQKEVWHDDYNTLKKNFHKFALRNHPDKGGIKEIFQSVSNCKDILDNDFETFKRIAKSRDSFSESDFAPTTSGSEYEEPKTQSKPKSKKQTKKRSHEYTSVDFDLFMQKDCVSGKGGWLATELANFCKILGINSTGKKQELCTKLKNYFDHVNTRQRENQYNENIRKQQDADADEQLRRKQAELAEIYRKQEEIRAQEETAKRTRYAAEDDLLAEKMSKLSTFDAVDDITTAMSNLSFSDI